MFIKPFKIKNNVQLKGSDVKKLKARLLQQFNLKESESSKLFPSKSSFNSVKIITHSEQQVIVYTVDKRPMIFEIQERLYPTIYALWLVPKIVSYFTTHPPVLPKLANGADLMLPGIVKEGTDLKSFGRFEKDDVVAVNLTSNSSAIAVGSLARSSEDLYMSGGHGICVKVLHVFGDKLWGMEASMTQQIPLNGPVVKAPALNSDNDFPALGSEPKAEDNSIKKKMSEMVIDNKTEADSSGESEEEQSPLINPDEVLRAMFLSALKLNRKEIISSLPILVGTFYPLYVQKQVQPNPDKPITVKDTSYKKLSTFMKKMSDDGFINVREENKGVEKIISINYDHPEIISHIPRKPNKTEDDASAEGTSHLLLTKMTELYVVDEKTKKLFNSLGVADGKALDKMQIKNYVKDYVARNKLINMLTKGVTLDDVLIEICAVQKENDDTILVMNIEQVIAIVQSQMNSTFEMRSQAGPQMKGGKKPIIQLTTATRMGNKKVTLVSNLEAYGKGKKLLLQHQTNINYFFSNRNQYRKLFKGMQSRCTSININNKSSWHKHKSISNSRKSCEVYLQSINRHLQSS